MSVTTQLLHTTGMSTHAAGMIDSSLSLLGSMGGLGMIRSSQLGSFPSFTLSQSLTVTQEKQLFSSSGKAYNQHLTKLAHSFSKHAGRYPETWGKLKGPMNSWHDQAYTHLKDIYSAPGQFQKITDPKTGLTWIEKRLPDGRGLRLNQDYTFKGFVD